MIINQYIEKRNLMRVFLILIIAVVNIKCSREQDRAKQPNVLFVFADQLRSCELGVYGGKNLDTPHLDQLANEGIIFDNAVSMTPLCTPFRGTILSGQYPTHTGIIINHVKADPNQQYIAQLFKANGYKTGFIGKWHLNKGADKQSEQFIPPGKDRLGFEHWEAYNYMHTFNNGFYYKDTPERLHMDKFETDFEFDRTIAFLEEQKQTDQPFFLMLAPHPPHPPFAKENCPDGYWEKVNEPFFLGPNVKPSHQKKNNKMHGYLALIKNLDDNIGRLMDYLDASGLSNNTIVIFTSDHGELMGAHGYHGKGRPYAESVNIPLFIRWPDHIPEGMRTSVLHSSIDHLPTLCSMAGIKEKDPVDGIDISGVWTSDIVSEREALLLANYTAGSRTGLFITDKKNKTLVDPMEWRGVKTKRYTYVEYINGEQELFDNVNDVYQMDNLAKDTSFIQVKNELAMLFNQLLAESHDQLYPGDYYADWYDKENNLVKTGKGKVN